MKKILAILSVAALIIGITACDGLVDMGDHSHPGQGATGGGSTPAENKGALDGTLWEETTDNQPSDLTITFNGKTANYSGMSYNVRYENSTTAILSQSVPNIGDIDFATFTFDLTAGTATMVYKNGSGTTLTFKKGTPPEKEPTYNMEKIYGKATYCTKIEGQEAPEEAELYIGATLDENNFIRIKKSDCPKMKAGDYMQFEVLSSGKLLISDPNHVPMATTIRLKNNFSDKKEAGEDGYFTSLATGGTYVFKITEEMMSVINNWNGGWEGIEFHGTDGVSIKNIFCYSM